MSSPPIDDVLDRVYRRARTLRRRRRLGIAVPTVLAVVVVLLLPSLRPLPHERTGRVVTGDGTAVAPTTSVQSTPGPTARPVAYTVTFGPNGPTLVQVDVTSGRVVSTFGWRQAGQGEGGYTMPSNPTLSPDGSTLYLRTSSGSCGGRIVAMDIAEPSITRPVVGEGVGHFAATDTTIAWHQCLGPDGRPRIVIRDLGSEQETTIDYDPRWGDAALALSPDGRTLAVQTQPGNVAPPEVRLVSLDDSSRPVLADTPKLEPPAGCAYAAPQFNSATGLLFLLARCNGGAAAGRLVAVEPDTRALASTGFAVSDDTQIDSFSIDGSGTQLLYRTAGGSGSRWLRVDDAGPPVAVPTPPFTMEPLEW